MHLILPFAHHLISVDINSIVKIWVIREQGKMLHIFIWISETKREMAWGGLAGWACLTVSTCTGLSAQAITGSVGHIHISICVLWLTAYHMHTNAVVAVLRRLRVCLQLQRLSLSAQATFSLQRTLYCCWSNNRKCKSHKKRDPTSYERYNWMSALTTSVITRLQFISQVCQWYCLHSN